MASVGFADCAVLPKSFPAGLTDKLLCAIMYLLNQYNWYKGVEPVEIIISGISGNSSKPIYAQITEQLKAQIMDGTLHAGESLPSMRSLAKSLHVSVITVQRAYEELQRDGFLETTVGRGSFVADQNPEIYREEQQRKAEEHLLAAAEIARVSGISLESLVQALTIFYREEE